MNTKPPAKPPTPSAFPRVMSPHKNLFSSYELDRQQFVSVIYKGLLEKREVEELVRLVLSRPAGFKPLLPQEQTDYLFEMMLHKHGMEQFIRGGMKTMAEWCELINNCSNNAITARNIMSKQENETGSIKLNPREPKDSFYTYDVVERWQRALRDIKKIEDHLYYHAEEIARDLGISQTSK